MLKILNRSSPSIQHRVQVLRQGSPSLASLVGSSALSGFEPQQHHLPPYFLAWQCTQSRFLDLTSLWRPFRRPVDVHLLASHRYSRGLELPPPSYLTPGTPPQPGRSASLLRGRHAANCVDFAEHSNWMITQSMVSYSLKLIM